MIKRRTIMYACVAASVAAFIAPTTIYVSGLFTANTLYQLTAEDGRGQLNLSLASDFKLSLHPDAVVQRAAVSRNVQDGDVDWWFQITFAGDGADEFKRSLLAAATAAPTHWRIERFVVMAGRSPPEWFEPKVGAPGDGLDISALVAETAMRSYDVSVDRERRAYLHLSR